MTPNQIILLASGGLFAGILAGFLGIGGGTVLVPLLTTLGYSPVESVATSSLSILITASSGTVQNWRMGYLNLSQVLLLGLPAIITAQFGSIFADRIPSHLLLFSFGLLLLLNLYLVQVRKNITQNPLTIEKPKFNPTFARMITGSIAGVMAGFLGVGGGVIMVPLQILWLGETIKDAVRISLGVIVITSLSACVGHALQNNVVPLAGILLGSGGLVGAQISTRFLPKLDDRVITFCFRLLLALLAIYVFWQAWLQWTIQGQ
ncbi:MAG: sulfite exporter TauE/SafE family protein [Roseofilum sp. SBFL]|uniref:sulfite exporter TauE/SafE family protein n=1 Tax=unclassified Roseofilum TaxID=2620099 RepID=UPI001B030A07|nr:MULTISPECIES: sulfite exporter TauE/SafE family protein [unclassified Roseofilum]MBP0015534.1 sulfite exporter TauE/SafE family protein [Roseofilum sp. SID3]MBP0025946.1 sulfite exporter TauE/SafE family protein [Roseofilum sp. SID2]MBP0042113.1 sulfite exporter TauE/SafE family protein [Roseofilum sp. SBFL]